MNAYSLHYIALFESYSIVEELLGMDTSYIHILCYYSSDENIFQVYVCLL